MINHNHSEQRRHTRPQRMTRKNHIIIRSILNPEALQRLGLLIQQPNGRFQKAVMNKPTIEHLHPQSIIQQQLVITLLHQIKTANGENNLAMVVVDVDYVGRSPTQCLLVSDALDEPLGVGAVAPRGEELGVLKIGFVDGEDQAADSRDGLEIVDSGGGPWDAVVGADVSAALPCPAQATQHDDALDSAGEGHWREIEIEIQMGIAGTQRNRGNWGEEEEIAAIVSSDSE